MSLIDITGMTKVYQMGQMQVHALRGIDLQIDAGEWVAIMGPSGSGKSTLMHMISCLDTPTSGSYLLDSVDVSKLPEQRLAAIRSTKIGFVFQTFNLLARTPADKQVMLPMQYARNGKRLPRSERRQRARAVLEMVGLGDRLSHRPSELSGGQQQRVAIARALVNEPLILIADEPTGNLDSQSGAEILEIFTRLHREKGITLVMVTHDTEVATLAQRVIRIKDGHIACDDKDRPC